MFVIALNLTINHTEFTSNGKVYLPTDLGLKPKRVEYINNSVTRLAFGVEIGLDMKTAHLAGNCLTKSIVVSLENFRSKTRQSFQKANSTKMNTQEYTRTTTFWSLSPKILKKLLTNWIEKLRVRPLHADKVTTFHPLKGGGLKRRLKQYWTIFYLYSRTHGTQSSVLTFITRGRKGRKLKIWAAREIFPWSKNLNNSALDISITSHVLKWKFHWNNVIRDVLMKTDRDLGLRTLLRECYGSAPQEHVPSCSTAAFSHLFKLLISGKQHCYFEASQPLKAKPCISNSYINLC